MLDLHIITNNLILDEEEPVLNVLGSLRTGAYAISSKKNDQFVVLVQDVVLTSAALGIWVLANDLQTEIDNADGEYKAIWLQQAAGEDVWQQQLWAVEQGIDITMPGHGRQAPSLCFLLDYLPQSGSYNACTVENLTGEW